MAIGSSSEDKERLFVSQRKFREPLPCLLNSQHRLEHSDAVEDFVEGDMKSGVPAVRSEEGRVGRECVNTCRSRWAPNHYKKTKKNNKHTRCTNHTTNTRQRVQKRNTEKQKNTKFIG